MITAKFKSKTKRDANHANSLVQLSLTEGGRSRDEELILGHSKVKAYPRGVWGYVKKSISTYKNSHRAVKIFNFKEDDPVEEILRRELKGHELYGREVYSFSRQGGKNKTKHYLVMPWIDGENIQYFLSEYFESYIQRIRLFLILLNEIKVLHDAGYMHGDLNPGNALATKTYNTETESYDYHFNIIDFSTLRKPGDRSFNARPAHLTPLHFNGYDFKYFDENSGLPEDIYALGHIGHMIMGLEIALNTGDLEGRPRWSYNAFYNPRGTHYKLRQLLQDMISETAGRRPNINTCISRVETLIDIKQEKINKKSARSHRQ